VSIKFPLEFLFNNTYIEVAPMKETKKKKTTSKRSVIENNQLNVNNALLAVISLLIIMSAIQVFQFQRLADAIKSGAVKTSAQSAGKTTNLPSQVGGCGQ